MLGLRPVLISFGLHGGPDADPEDQQVEYDGGHQARDVESHVTGAAAQTQCGAALLAGCWVNWPDQTDSLTQCVCSKWVESPGAVGLTDKQDFVV